MFMSDDIFKYSQNCQGLTCRSEEIFSILLSAKNIILYICKIYEGCSKRVAYFYLET